MVRPEDRFRQWRDGGDAEALAEVYDLAAPTLLRLALHHVRHPASAEDLVQATFLAAIQNAGSYDPQRPLLAWLVGILHNQAKWLQRREGRAVDPTRLADRAEHDPLAAAQIAEFSAQCDEAIESLPDVYRPVLRLHLKHQLTAAEIAHVLGRPPGTVRSQVVRGLELLRAALPAGIALAAFAVLTPGRGLAAVRDVVLAAGGARAASVALAAAGTSAAILGGVTMKKAMLGVVVLLALSAGSWWAFAGSVDPGLAEPQAPTVETASTRAAAAANATAAPAPAPELSRDAAAAGAPSWRLVGRVFEDGAPPVADASVQVQLVVDHEREPLADARTDADGRYTVDLEALRALPPIDLRRAQLSVSIHAPGRRSGGQVTLPHRDPTQSLVAIGDAQLVAAAIVSGRVVDADGIPVAGANVQLSRASGASVQHNRATTDANGCYVVAAPLESGDLLVAATHMGVGRAQAECTLAPGSETTLPDLRLQASSTLRARVVFADGEPASHVGTGIYQPGDDSHTVSMARTDDDGRLVVRTLPPGRYTVRLSSFGGGSCPSTTVATDEDPATIVLRDVHVLRFSFRDEAGRPLRPMDVAMGIWPASNQAAAAFAAGAPLDAELQDRYSSAGGSFRCLVVARGTWIRVDAHHDNARAEVMVQAMPPRNVIETVLTLRERERDATLRLQLTTPDGSDLGDIEARLRQLYLGEPGSYELELQRDGTNRLVRWFPGRYRLEVAPKESGSEFGWFAPFERPVQLRRGETTTVAASVPAGGRVRFHLHTPEPRAREGVVDFAVETPAATGPAGRQRRVFIEMTAGGWNSGGFAPAGVPLLWAPVLPPGNHVLAIRSRDYADTSVAAVVAAREVTDVHVWLQPR